MAPSQPRVSVQLHTYGGRAYGLRWRYGARTGEVSSGTTNRREAERAAGRLEEQLLLGQVPGRGNPSLVPWPEFREAYERQWLEGMSFGSRQGWRTAANHFERICSPRYVADIDKAMVSRYLAGLESLGISSVSVRSYYAALRAGLGWAESVDMLDAVPVVRRRKAPPRAPSRDRVVTGEEFERILDAAPAIWRHEPAALRRFLLGLWHSGLRIDELNRLSIDPQAPLRLENRLIVIHGAQKNKQDSYLPAPPEFWQQAGESPCIAGRVFSIPGERGKPLSTRAIGRMVSACGKRAKVVVNHVTGKCASAHDLRAAYITRLSAVGSLFQVQRMARHSDPKTTATHYVRHEAEALSKAFGWS
jgi:integrase